MAWLDALLAFAITMMVLSTIVSVIVEAGHSLLNQRVKCLERLMQQMFDKVISPQLAGQLPTDLTGSRFVKQMTGVRYSPIETNAPRWRKAWHAFLNKLRKTDKAQSLTTLEFFERLAETPVGAALLERSVKIDDQDEALSVFLEDMANKFEAFGDEASKFFTRRARMFSVLIGFVLVFSINFSAFDVAQTLMQSEEARMALIEQGEQIADHLNQQLEETEQRMREATQEGQSVPEFDTEKLKQSFQENMRVLQQAQLPIGWEHAPWNKTDEKISGWQYLGWFASLFVAGLLVGLGGPFWFDTFRKLSALSSIAKVFESEVMQGSDKAKKPPGPEKRKERFVGVFKTTRQASQFAKAAGRQPLMQDGNTIPMGHIR